jgi:hypothetical protein
MVTSGHIGSQRRELGNQRLPHFHELGFEESHTCLYLGQLPGLN